MAKYWASINRKASGSLAARWSIFISQSAESESSGRFFVSWVYGFGERFGLTFLRVLPVCRFLFQIYHCSVAD